MKISWKHKAPLSLHDVKLDNCNFTTLFINTIGNILSFPEYHSTVVIINLTT